MQDRDWTGTAAAFIALAMTAGVWLWPQGETPPALEHGRTASLAEDRSAEEVKRWRAEARRWDGTTDGVQLSAANPVAPEPAILR